MNDKQRKTYDKWVKENCRIYPVRQVIYPRAPMTHVSIFASKYYDMKPYEVAQINEEGKLHKYLGGNDAPKSDE